MILKKPLREAMCKFWLEEREIKDYSAVILLAPIVRNADLIFRK